MFKCRKCDWIGNKPKEKSVNKVKYKTCPECSDLVDTYVIPMNERVGRCFTCGHAKFKLAITYKQLLRGCRNCGEIYNTDTEKVIVKGELK